MEAIVAKTPSRGLTEAEIRVLRAYVDHDRHTDAAEALGISTQTLKNHLGSIYKKLGVTKAHTAIYKLACLRGVDVLDGEYVDIRAVVAL